MRGAGLGEWLGTKGVGDDNNGCAKVERGAKAVQTDITDLASGNDGDVKAWLLLTLAQRISTGRGEGRT